MAIDDEPLTASPSRRPGNRELYIDAFKGLAKTNNTLIIPSNLSDVAALVASAMTVLDRSKMTEAVVK